MSIAERAEAEARRWLGTPYRHQASIRGAGCDCLGLLRGVWRGLYGSEPVVLPAYPAEARRDNDPAQLQKAADTYLVRKAGEPVPGDVLLFRLSRNLPPRHCGIAIAGGFIHAQERLGVIETALSESWRRRLAALYGFPDDMV